MDEIDVQEFEIFIFTFCEIGFDAAWRPRKFSR